MSAVNIANVTVLDDTAAFLYRFHLETSHECLVPLKDDGDIPKNDDAQISTQFKILKQCGNFEKSRKATNGTEIKSKKLKKEIKRKKKDSVPKKGKIERTLNFINEENVEEISSVDEDCTRGMRSPSSQVN